MNQFKQCTARLIELALAEDIGHGDLTTELTIDPTAEAHANILGKQELVLAGCDVFDAVLHRVDPRISVAWNATEGDLAAHGTILGEVQGPAAAILTGERTALNFLQRLSGVATQTRRYVTALNGTNCRLADTRKTTPGWRTLEKAAVRAGGAMNHRFALDSGIMLKDNHIHAAGSITDAVANVRRHAPHLLKIEVEVTTLDELRQALDAHADVVLLDNMDLETLRRAVQLAKGKALTEASGGITLETIRAVAETGVDVISVGALTHSATGVDISLDFV